MEWYEELDFDENPLDTNPIRFADKLVGMEEIIDELAYRAGAGSMVFIEGKKGLGKTALLWSIIRKYRGHGRVIYVDCGKIEKELNIEKLLVQRNGISGVIFGKKPKDMILLLDNVSALSKTNMERIKFFFDEGYLLSAVFTGTDYESVKFSKSIKDRIGKRIIRLKELEPYQAVSLVRNRIGNTEMITDDLIELAFAKAGKSPLVLLEKLDIIFGKAIESKKEKLTKEDLRSI
jgi:Cdc6-like AAA superfamily ATPase